MNVKKGTKTKKVSDKKKKFFIEHIAKFCDKCGTEYKTDNIEILQKSDYSTIIHFFCANCKASQMATFIQPLGISSRMPVNTDLDLKEIQKVVKRPAVSSDEVIDVHEFLEDPNLKVDDIL